MGVGKRRARRLRTLEAVAYFRRERERFAWRKRAESGRKEKILRTSAYDYAFIKRDCLACRHVYVRFHVALERGKFCVVDGVYLRVACKFYFTRRVFGGVAI